MKAAVEYMVNKFGTTDPKIESSDDGVTVVLSNPEGQNLKLHSRDLYIGIEAMRTIIESPLNV